jgi:hypothetical protein
VAHRGLPEAEWHIIREAYEEGTSLTEIGREYDVSAQAVHKQAKKRGWARANREVSDVQADVDRLTTAKLAGGFNHAGVNHEGINHAGDDEGDAAALEGAADLRLRMIQRHRTAWSEVRELGRMAFQAALDPDWVPPGDEPGHPLPFGKRIEYATSLSKLFKQHAAELMTAQEGERRAHGFDYRIQQAETKPPEDPLLAIEKQQSLQQILDNMNSIAGQKAPPPASTDTET